MIAGGWDDLDIGLKAPVSANIQAEHRSTEKKRTQEWSAWHILDHIYRTTTPKPISNLWDQVWVIAHMIDSTAVGGERLTRWRSPDQIEPI